MANYDVQIIKNDDGKFSVVVVNDEGVVVAGPFTKGGRIETVCGKSYFRTYDLYNGWSNHAYLLD